ncbi:uncharacterized protein LOC135376812 [Ornithodoros turicata]|uniref:uncharacterized protein LOC135376812 n=1 Tax=Ornithodoros turicata TaxID=34597 RepID=UPI00313A0CE0
MPKWAKSSVYRRVKREVKTALVDALTETNPGSSVSSLLPQSIPGGAENVVFHPQHVEIANNTEDHRNLSGESSTQFDGSPWLESGAESLSVIDSGEGCDADDRSCDFVYAHDDRELCSRPIDETESSASVCAGPDAGNTNDFCTRLRIWSVETGVTHSQLTGLLNILHTHPCFSNLPRSARTLLKTPRASPDFQDIHPGKYHHFGLASGLRYVLKNALSLPDILLLNVNIDGLPLTKSTTQQFWPILCDVVNCEKSEPFPVGIYFGHTKPSNANDYLKLFVSEVKELLLNGVEIGGSHVPIKIEAFVCDAPARAFILSVKSHSGYFSCTRCTTKGSYRNGHVCFPEMNAPLRDDTGFRAAAQEQHHTGSTILREIAIDLVHQVPLEYMHLVCLGVMRKLLLLWCKATSASRISSAKREELSQKNIAMGPHMPLDFNRRPRSVDDLDRWKATELRTMLVYTGPVVLHQVLPKDMYANYLVLHVAITILISPTLCEVYLEYAERLLQHFVQVFISTYGSHLASYNIHGLLHLAGDARMHGPLDRWSAFPFENFMKTLKSMKKKPEKALEQLVNRITEQRSVAEFDKRKKDDETMFSQKHHDGPLLDTCRGSQYRKVQIQGKFFLQVNGRDSVCVLSDGTIVEILNIVCPANTQEACILGRKFIEKHDLYTYPCKSTMLGICKVSRMSVLQSWPLSSVQFKCVRLPFETVHVIIPLHHTT